MLEPIAVRSILERWKITLYTVWLSQTISIMSFSLGMPFIPFYIQEMGIIRKEQIDIYTAILSAAPAITLAIMSPVWGIAADRWGKKLMLLRAMLFSSLIIAGMGMVANVNQLVVLRLLQGIFTGTITASSALVASETPNSRLSYSLGFLSSSTFIGSSIGPVIGGFFAGYIGYRPSFFIGGALMLLDFFIVLFFVKSNAEESRSIEAEGTYIDLQDKKPELTESYDKKPEQSEFYSKKYEDRHNGFKENMKIFLSPVILVMFYLIFTMRLSRSVFNPYLPLFVQEIYSNIKIAARNTGIVNGVTGLVTALAGLTLSRLGDKYNKTGLLIVFLLISTVVSIPLGFINNLWIFTIFYGLFFFVMGGAEPVIMSITTEIIPAGRRGALFGIQGFVGSMGWVVSPLLGSMISLRFSYLSVTFLIPLIVLPSLITVIFLNRKMKSN